MKNERITQPSGQAARRAGPYAAFFDGLEKLRARVEDPHARQRKLDVDFAGLCADLTQHIYRFELFRPLLWSFFLDLVRSEERLSAEMLLSVLVEALPAALSAEPTPEERARLVTACRFVATGAEELSRAGAPGVSNRVVLNALARFERTLRSTTERESTARLQAFATLLEQLVLTLPIERSRLLIGYARQSFERALNHAPSPQLQEIVTALWVRLFERVFSAVAPGARSPAVSHLLVTIARLLPDERTPNPTMTLLVERLSGLAPFRDWWVGFVERAADEALKLPPRMQAVAAAAVRHGGGDEPRARAEKRMRALAKLGDRRDCATLLPLLGADESWRRKAALEGLAQLAERGAVADGFLNAITTALDDQTGEVALAAVRALGRLDRRPTLVNTSGGEAAQLPAHLFTLIERTPRTDLLLRAEAFEALAVLTRLLAGTKTPEEFLSPDRWRRLTAERDHYRAMARGKQRDRILATLERLSDPA